MQIGYLRGGPGSHLKDGFALLESAGCDRIIVDHGSSYDSAPELFATIAANLQKGDTLIVRSMGDIANSLSQFVNLVLGLEAQDIRFRALEEGFDTAGKRGPVVRSVLHQLRTFERQTLQRGYRNEGGSRKAGRPKALSAEAAAEARALLQQGHSIAEVAAKFRVSRATLYRYLG